MNIVGIERPILPANDFRTVIFCHDGCFFVQKRNKTKFYEFVKIELDDCELLEPQVQVKMNYSDTTEKILGYVNESNDLYTGTFSELTPKMIELLYHTENIAPMAKLKISKKFQFNGLSKKLQLESIEYLNRDKIRVKFDDSNDGIAFVNDVERLSEPILKTVNQFHHLIDTYSEIKWNHVLEFCENYNEVRINKIKSSLSNFFDLISKEEDLANLKASIVKNANAMVSFSTENKYFDQEEIQVQIENKAKRIKEKSLADIVQQIKTKHHG